MEFIDDAEFQIAIDNDNGARITSLKWRDNEFAVPFRGQVHTSGWYAMAPWAGRINEGLIKDSQGQEFQLPATIDPPHALHGLVLSLLGKRLALVDHYYIYQHHITVQLLNNL